MSVIHDIVDADILYDFDGNDVSGFCQRLSQQGGSVEFFAVILRFPFEVLLPVLEHDRRIDDDRCRRVSFVDRSGINDRLEGGTGLAPGLQGPIELIFPEVAPADHALDVAGFSLDAQERSLSFGDLLQCQVP